MNPVASAKTSTKSVLSEVRHHPIAMLLFGMVFGAFLFGPVASWLGRVKSSGSVFGKVIPGFFTR